jgi:hypothetical protein
MQGPRDPKAAPTGCHIRRFHRSTSISQYARSTVRGRDKDSLTGNSHLHGSGASHPVVVVQCMVKQRQREKQGKSVYQHADHQLSP